MRIAFVYIILFFLTSLLYSNEIKIVNSDIIEFPDRQVEFYYYDANKLPIDNLISSEIIFKINTKDINNFELIPPFNTTSSPLSIVISIDISEQNKDNLDSITTTIRKMAEYTNALNNIDISIQTYNSKAFLVQDYTKDLSSIERALNIINSFGISNYNAAFLTPIFGSIDIAKRAKNKAIIINITNGNLIGDSTKIINDANSNSIEIYNLINSNILPNNLLSISERTNGKAFKYNDNRMLLAKLMYIINKSSNVNPYRLNYSFNNCDSSNNINLTINNLNSDNYKAEYKSNKFPTIEVIPNSIDFGEVPVGESKSAFFTLISRNAILKIEDIIPNNPNYIITPDYKNVTLFTNTPKVFNVKYTSTTTEYNYNKLTIISDACKTSSLEILSGKTDGNSQKTQLKVIYPNGNEIFYPGEKVRLQWDGVLDSQNVILEYSADNGQTWNTITDRANGKYFDWKVPNIVSDQMLLRVDIPSGNLKYDKVKYIEESDKNKKIKQAVLSYDNKYSGVSFEDGSIIIWDLVNDTLKSRLRDSNPGFITTDINFGINSHLFATSFGRNGDYNVVVWDSDDPSITYSQSFNSKPNAIEWSDNGTSIYIGFENGKLLEWDITNGNTRELTDIMVSINNISLNNSKKYICISTNNNLLLIDNNGIKLDSININGINEFKWNKSESKLFVSYQFEDLRIFNLTEINGKAKLNPESRINRTGAPIIRGASWIDNNSLLLYSKDNNIIEYWSINSGTASKLIDIDIHKFPIKSLSTNGTQVVSFVDSNFALVWNVQDYPFSFKTFDDDVSDDNWSINQKLIEKNKINLPDLCINFSYYFVNNTSFKNLTEPSIIIDSIVPSTTEIQIQNIFPLKIDKNNYLNLKFNYTPKNIGTFEHNLYVYHGFNKDTIKIRSKNTATEYAILNDNITFKNSFVNLKSLQKENILINLFNRSIKFDSLNFVYGNDVFNIKSSNYNNLLPNEKLYIEIEFEPLKAINYSGLIKLYSKELCSPVYISIYGNGIEPKLVYTNDIDFGTVQCNMEVDTSIYIKNLSLNSIELISSKLLNNNNIFTINDNLPKILNTNDSVRIDIRFNKGDIGMFDSQLEIKTNMTGIKENLIVNLSAIRDSVKLNFLSNILDFGSVSNGQKPTKNLKIVNESNLLYNFTPPIEFNGFQLVSAEPQVIGKKDTSLVTFKYIGNDNDTTINILFPIGNGCDSKIELPISINISAGKAHIQIADKKNIGIINCEDRIYLSEFISNIGSNDLKINNIHFEGNNSNDFKLENNYSGISIAPNNSEEIKYSYLPKNEGFISTNMVIESNAENSILNLNKLEITGEYRKTLLDITSDTIKFEGLRSNRIYYKSLIIKNIGNNTITPTYTNDVNFQIDSITPKTIMPNEESEVYISFLGGNINTIYNGEIQFYDDCEKQYTINLVAEVGGSDFVTLEPEKINSKTGSLVNINIKFENSSGIVIPKNDTIQTKLIFNSTLLVPVDDRYKGTINSKGEREIDLKFPLQDKPYIYHIPALVTLGDTSFSTIRLEQSTHLTNGFYIDDFKKGNITITNIVRKPTDRYIYGKGNAYLSETFPSPVLDIATINYGIIESTNVNISIYDILGNKVLELLNKYHIPGEYSIKINPQSLSSGNYLYKLETPSMEIIKKMTIIR